MKGLLDAYARRRVRVLRETAGAFRAAQHEGRIEDLIPLPSNDGAIEKWWGEEAKA